MSAAYWAQWSHTEIMSMHGVELDDCVDEDVNFDYDVEECEEECEDSCPRCTGSGCNYCLMCEW